MPLGPEFHETFNRIFEERKELSDWLDVYIWEIDRETIRYANPATQKRLRIIVRYFYRHVAEITRWAHRDQNHITVQDVLDYLILHNE